MKNFNAKCKNFKIPKLKMIFHFPFFQGISIFHRNFTFLTGRICLWRCRKVCPCPLFAGEHFGAKMHFWAQKRFLGPRTHFWAQNALFGQFCALARNAYETNGFRLLFFAFWEPKSEDELILALLVPKVQNVLVFPFWLPKVLKGAHFCILAPKVQKRLLKPFV